MSLVGVVIGVTWAIVGAVTSMVKLVTFNGVLALVAASVTVMVQLEWLPSERVVKVMVLLPAVAVVVALLQSPP